MEDLFRREIEFDSRDDLYARLDGTMPPPVFDAVLDGLLDENMVLADGDGTLTWIYMGGNDRFKKLLEESVLDWPADLAPPAK